MFNAMMNCTLTVRDFLRQITIDKGRFGEGAAIEKINFDLPVPSPS